jgi:predicted kinase
MFRSGCNDFLLVQDSFRLLGLEDVVGIDERVVCSAGFATPSDHFGILCEYAFGAEPSAVVSYEANNLMKAAGKAISVKALVVLVLIGAPGSGKSTLASLLCPGFVRISQDELGNRAKCMDAAHAALQSGISIIVDRCNFDAQQRSTWLSLAERCCARTVAVQLDVPLVVCIQRVAARKVHEGGVDGNSQATIDIVTKLHGDQKCVTDDEGFHHVHVFQQTSTPESIAAELRLQYSSHETSCPRGSTSLPSYSAARLRQVSSALHPIGVQSDSSSESSQERAVLQLSECVAPPVSALSEHLAPHHPPAASVSADKADASNDECVLVEHVPPRSYVFMDPFCCSALIFCI